MLPQGITFFNFAGWWMLSRLVIILHLYKYRIIILYTWDYYNALYQLYFNLKEKNEQTKNIFGL